MNANRLHAGCQAADFAIAVCFTLDSHSALRYHRTWGHEAPALPQTGSLILLATPTRPAVPSHVRAPSAQPPLASLAATPWYQLSQLRAAPNQMTILRLCIVPLLVRAILEAHYVTAFTLFMVAGMTDGLDGVLARILGQRTRLGQYLDPVADKLLLSTLFLVLNHVGLISREVTVLVFARDLGIVAIAAVLFFVTGLRDFRPSIFGKANTLAQIMALVTVLLAQFYSPAPVEWVRHWSLNATMALTLISALDYARQMPERLDRVDRVDRAARLERTGRTG